MQQFGSGLYKTFFNIRTQVKVRTDNGYVFEEFQELESASYARTETVVSEKAEDESLGVAQYIIFIIKKLKFIPDPM